MELHKKTAMCKYAILYSSVLSGTLLLLTLLPADPKTTPCFNSTCRHVTNKLSGLKNRGLKNTLMAQSFSLLDIILI